MGIDDILNQKAEEKARAEEAAREAPAKAQAMRNALHKRLMDDLLAAIRSINDPALGNCAAIPVTDAPGSNRRTVQIDCRGRVRVLLTTVVRCAPGDPHARYESIRIRVGIGAPAQRVIEGTFDGSGARQLDSKSDTLIDADALKSRIHSLVEQL